MEHIDTPHDVSPRPMDVTRTRPDESWHLDSVDSELLDVAQDVACLPLSIVNIYFYGDAQSADRPWVLIDAGLVTSRGAIEHAAAERFGPNRPPVAIVLTHGHFDHVGALADLWQVPVYAHELEFPYLQGQSSYPPPDPAVGGGAMSFLSRLYPRGPINLGNRLRALPADGSVPGMPGWRWIHTPGHAPGHVALFRDSDRTLIAGDAFVTQRQESAWSVLTRRQEVCRPPAYYTTDWPAARRSVALLSDLQPSVAATGHGLPMYGPAMREGLAQLLRNWDQIAVPAYGRYVGQSAVTDRRGVVSVPPPVIDRQLIGVAGLGLATLAGMLMFRGKSRTESAGGEVNRYRSS